MRNVDVAESESAKTSQVSAVTTGIALTLTIIVAGLTLFATDKLRAGYRISYLGFLRVGFLAAVITMTVGTLWLLVRF